MTDEAPIFQLLNEKANMIVGEELDNRYAV